MTAISASVLRIAMEQCKILLSSAMSRTCLLNRRSGCLLSPLLSLSGQTHGHGVRHFFSEWTHKEKTVVVSRSSARFSMRFVHQKARTTSENTLRTVESVCAEWTERLERGSITEPRVSVEYIVAHVLGKKTLYGVKPQCGLNEHEVLEINTLCERRMRHEPVQYILGEWDFDDIELKLRPPVFIPRPETEELVGLAAESIQRKTCSMQGGGHLLELCCGSGAITLALLHRFPQLQAVAVDVSLEACSLTEENALRLGLNDRLTIVQGGVGDEEVEQHLKVLPTFDILVSNPPYIPTQEVATLEKQILLFEDQIALDGGSDGLNVVRDIIRLCPSLLTSDSDVLLEIQPGQPHKIKTIVSYVQQSCLRFLSSYNDYLGRERFCHLRRI